LDIDIDKYEHFSFDLWLTLIKSNPLFKRKRNELLRDAFSIKTNIEEIDRVVRYYDVVSNKISEKTGLHIERLNIYLLILNKLNIDIQSINIEELDLFCVESENLFKIFRPELIDSNINELFKKIQFKGKTMNILSNTAFIEGKCLRELLDYYELSHYFSFQLYSDEVGYSKPNRKFFNLLFEKANESKVISQKQIIHIGDNEIADIRGATEAGFSSFLIKKLN
jgi:putative hydrolase of the HAD superfamily